MHNDISSHPKQQKAKHNADGQIGYGHSELTGVVQSEEIGGKGGESGETAA